MFCLGFVKTVLFKSIVILTKIDFNELPYAHTQDVSCAHVVL